MGRISPGWAAAPGRPPWAGVAYVPEGRLIFPDLSVLENIRVGERRPAKVWTMERLLALVSVVTGTRGAIAALAVVGRGAADAGHRSSALVSDPRVVLLDDEPKARGLAPLVVQELAAGHSWTVCRGRDDSADRAEHEAGRGAVADELHIMVKGRIVYGASPDVLPGRRSGDPGTVSDGLISSNRSVDRDDRQYACTRCAAIGAIGP